VTGPSASVTANSATLNGTVNPNGQATTYYFEYGTTSGYGSQTASQSAGSGSSDVGVSANLSALSSGATYHYRLVATNSSGTTRGADKTFTTAAGTSYGGTVLATGGLVSYWRLGEASGSIAADEKQANPGTYSGGFSLGQPGAIAGDSNSSVSLDGSSGLMSGPANVGGAQGAIEFWGYASDLNSRNGVVYTADNGQTTNTHQLGVLSDGSVRLYLYDGARRTVNSAPGLVRANEWHYYALTWSDGGSAKLYVDGVERGSVSIGSSWKAGNKVLFGAPAAAPSGLPNSWQGRIDEAAVYNSALPATTIQQHYNLGQGN